VADVEARTSSAAHDTRRRLSAVWFELRSWALAADAQKHEAMTERRPDEFRTDPTRALYKSLTGS
jgi:hypothetical protein